MLKNDLQEINKESDYLFFKDFVEGEEPVFLLQNLALLSGLFTSKHFSKSARQHHCVSLNFYHHNNPVSRMSW